MEDWYFIHFLFFKVCAFNRTVEKVDRFLANEAKGNDLM